MMAAQQMGNQHEREILVPLRTFTTDATTITSNNNKLRPNVTTQQYQQRKKNKARDDVLVKTTVSFGIAELLRHAMSRPPSTSPAYTSTGVATGGRNSPSADGKRVSPPSLVELCHVDNFRVRVDARDEVAANDDSTPSVASCRSWTDINGIDLLSPPPFNNEWSVTLVEPSFLSFSDSKSTRGDERSDDEISGRYLEVEYRDADMDATIEEHGHSFSSDGVRDGDDTHNDSAAGGAVISKSAEFEICHALGCILYEIFMQKSRPESEESGPASKRSRTSNHDRAAINNTYHGVAASLLEEGYPPSIGSIVQNLLECSVGKINNKNDSTPTTSYDSIGAACADLHLLLNDPHRFLFNEEVASGKNGDSDDNKRPLLVRRYKLYGRENEVSLITDAFCRVSTGKSEALFIGGFSGSGKSRLVDDLIARVGVSGGYVIKHKFDQISKERPLLEVVSAFNRLCTTIKERSSNEELALIRENLVDVFGTDFSVITRLLPNIGDISPSRTKEETDGLEMIGNQMNLRSICFSLWRFMRVISMSIPSHPVMLFLDDLQWCDYTALSIVESVFCGDTEKGRYFFFVGSYRANEVGNGHALFTLMEKLKNRDVPVNEVCLDGLPPDDLNTMISDATCMLPRKCKPLSDIVFQKTAGNPFFALECLRSWVDAGQLRYSSKVQQWVWDEERISSTNITSSALCLLSLKMENLKENDQLALKVAACFGIKIKQSAVDFLSANDNFAGIKCGFDRVVNLGLMTRVGTSHFQFAHDQIREAAYRLIPSEEAQQHHFNIGRSLYAMTKETAVEDDIVFSVADLINYGKHIPYQCAEMRLDANELAGTRAAYCSDYSTSNTYLSTALALLPDDHWETLYSRSLRLFLLAGKVSYSFGAVERAQEILREIITGGHCVEDKLQAYYWLTKILYSCGKHADAYSVCREVLHQLGHNVPTSLKHDNLGVVKELSPMLKHISAEYLLTMKEPDEKIAIAVNFYSLMASVALAAKQQEMIPFLCCRVVKLTIENGICNHSILGFLQLSGLCAGDKMNDTNSATQIANAAIEAFERRFYSSEQLPIIYEAYYGGLAYQTKPLQFCSEKLQVAFDVGMSNGDFVHAFINAVQLIKTSFIGGENLLKLRNKLDYFLGLANQYHHQVSKTYLSIFRDTILQLIGTEETRPEDLSTESSTSSNLSFQSVLHFHRALTAFWLGHTKRSLRHIEKYFLASTQMARLNHIMITFIHGLISIRVKTRTTRAKLKSIQSYMNVFASSSSHNFSNKAHLLAAEDFSHREMHEDASVAYAAAITAAKSSGFVHEQGLACELAAEHYKKQGGVNEAKDLFAQAKRCYEEWGSGTKVDHINRQQESLGVGRPKANTL